MAKQKKKIPIKRGKLSAEEKKLIEEWVDLKTDEQMSVDLRRTIEQIREYKDRYLADAPMVVVKRTEAEQYRRELKAHPDWSGLQNSFTPHELINFETKYISYRQQFKDITATEEGQIHQLITLDIFMMRHNQERMSSQMEIERLRKLLNELYNLPVHEQNPEILLQLETNLQANKAASSQRTREYKDLLEKHQGILKDLKGTRDQRVKNLDQRGKFLEILKTLTLEDVRTEVDTEVGLHKEATKNERKRLSEPHKYQDGVIDKPILIPEDNDA